MTRKELGKRQARIAAGRCPRCNRPVDPWPLKRPDNCGPGTETCMRGWPDIIAAEKLLKVTQ